MLSSASFFSCVRSLPCCSLEARLLGSRIGPNRGEGPVGCLRGGHDLGTWRSTPVMTSHCCASFRSFRGSGETTMVV